MGIPEAWISTMGNLISSMAELVGSIMGDTKMTFKPNSVKRKFGAHEQEEVTPLNLDSDPNNNNNSQEDIYSNPDIYLTVPQLIEKMGYPFESHEVVTKDGYILTVFRIRHGRLQEEEDSDSMKPPILLVHGLLNSAGAWIMHQQNKAFAYMLADKGFDCWMINCRGCSYSRKHSTLSVEDKQFWDFSFHEMGAFDVPAVIDHILTTTGHQNLFYCGHSLGSTMLMIAINEDQKIINKIKLFIAFAPAVYLYKTTAKFLSINAPFHSQQKAILDFFTRNGEFMSKTFVEQFQTLKPLIRCPEYFGSKCVQASMYTMGGYNPDQIYWPQLPILAAHSPSSTSVRTYIHCLQYFNKPYFQQYDYGSSDANHKVYGQPSPKMYDLKKVVKTPIVIFYGENDLLCRPEAVQQLASELPNVIGCHKVPCEKFSHTDFLYAKDVDKLVYNKVIELLNNSISS